MAESFLKRPNFESRPQFIDSEDLNKRTRGDLKPEIHFIGQVVAGHDFETADGLFCEMLIDVGNWWELISAPRTYQTQTAYAEVREYVIQEGEPFVWCHPFDLHFAVNDLKDWPKAIFRIWRLDEANNIDSYAYGVASFPKKAGFSQVTCDTWTPSGWRIGDNNFANLSFFMNNQPKIASLDILSKSLDQRQYLNTFSNGKIVMEIEVCAFFK